jgi:hypothetical protein
MAWGSIGRTIGVLVAAAVLLSACANDPTFRAGGYGGSGSSGGGSYSRAKAGVGIPF